MFFSSLRFDTFDFSTPINLIKFFSFLKVVFDRLKGMALILYNNTDFAQTAVRETKGWKIGGNKIKVKIK